MSKKYKGQTRPVQVMNKQSGESTIVDGPVNIRNQKGDPDSLMENAGAPNLTPLVQSLPPAETIPPVENVAGKAKKEKVKKEEILTVSAYLESFYAGKSKSLNEKMIKTIGQNPTLDPDLCNNLVERVSKTDLSLEKTRHLLLLAAHIESHKALARTLQEFARSVMMQHPLMERESRDDWFPTSSEVAVRPIREYWEHSIIGLKQSTSIVNDKSATDKEKKAATELVRARRNIFFSTLLWRYSEKQLSFFELIHALRSTAFESSTQQDQIKFNALEFLVLSQDKDKQGIASLMRWFHDQVSQAKTLEDHERNRATRLQDEVHAGQELLKARESEIDDLKQEIAALRMQLDVVKEEVRVSGVHFRDDLERQRSRTLLALEDEIPVLKDCLTALDRDPPKVGVAKEYLGTALDNLNEELKMLRGN
jgi:hypothetical protein